MRRIETKLEGVWRLVPRVFRDERGLFLETWNKTVGQELGLEEEFVQDNCSHSVRGVLRGLHYQSGVAAQGKLVSVSAGEVFDVVVDLREASATFGQWEGHVISAENRELLWVPPGFAHGFLVLSESADFHYKCTRPYQPGSERSLCWDDATVGIAWPLPEGEKPLLSPKDAAAASWEDCEKFGATTY
jgi:dTDP-4-dehydrorhamnose 3,5-epimerase